MTGKALVPGRGRNPKPTAVKKRQGNPGKRKLNENELVSEQLTIDTPPPDDLNEDGKAMWHFVLKELCPQGIVLKTEEQRHSSGSFSFCFSGSTCCAALTLTRYSSKPSTGFISSSMRASFRDIQPSVIALW